MVLAWCCSRHGENDGNNSGESVYLYVVQGQALSEVCGCLRFNLVPVLGTPQRTTEEYSDGEFL